MTDPDDAAGQTYITRFRVPRVMWEAYGRVAERIGVTRSADLLDHIRDVINAHGDEQDLADLARADRELSERRARKGGRPPKSGQQ
ncbi:hypothetical protein BJF79_13640 [Actinomadura sp. CNU-125]|uniref:hypothetical protein n=1 Tax=Actinomadura sp. CNU-125 TaxID=1904961 RepID=UPI0009600483|nr:hypothetical protein [Actinomadura sp. CNU-125]OLT24380.1 hypothetical protein BJF79_13640 [Actinomadura sp. CNU-125]